MYYYNQEYFSQFNRYPQNLYSEQIFPVNTVDQINPEVLSRASKIIYFEEWSSLVDKENRNRNTFDSLFLNHAQYRFEGTFNVYVFEKRRGMQD
jgi:hypothetical protein